MLFKFIRMTGAILKFHLWRRKRKDALNSTGNHSNCEEEKDVLKGGNIASLKGVRLKGKFVSKTVLNLWRGNLSA